MTDEGEVGDAPVSVREAARSLGVHENTIRNWEKRGVISRSIVLPSGVRRFSVEDVERVRRLMWMPLGRSDP